MPFLETNSEYFKIVYSFPFTDKEIKISANKTINEEQTKFDLLEENQIIEFKLRNGKRYKAQVLRDSTTKMYYLNAIYGSNAIYFMDLNQMDYKNNLNKLYGNNDVYPSAPNLECLTNDLNTLIQLPDLSNKETPLADLQKEVEIEKKCEELIAKFMPFVNEWKECDSNAKDVLLTKTDDPDVYKRPYNWKYKNKREAAIKVAILHCELLLCKIIHAHHYADTSLIKNQLEKMLEQ